MPLLTYEIFRKESTDFIWVGAAQELESARKRVKELSIHSEDEFVVFDQRTMQIVASLHSPNCLTLKP